MGNKKQIVWDKKHKVMRKESWFAENNIFMSFNGDFFKYIIKNGKVSTVEIKDRFIPLQYTGKNDVEGLEIYEDFIIEYVHPYSEKTICLVEYNNDHSGYYPLYCFNSYFKIIGNKYENSELLKECTK